MLQVKRVWGDQLLDRPIIRPVRPNLHGPRQHLDHASIQREQDVCLVGVWMDASTACHETRLETWSTRSVNRSDQA